ncbi:hypothetical protein DFQ27_009825 [Actinomortierella ambigua]|uniref:Uncharacterized protein n=1 Tax=Actinomortierella ambigua TaxID=1343610 RepID=A0A9P6QDQ6_9FUNG|nr:hypothetical protein DFQ27_009825 [Actinomortierella ambigua]
MSGLLLNCLLPFVRPPQSVNVNEVKTLPLNQFLDKHHTYAHSNGMIVPVWRDNDELK